MKERLDNFLNEETTSELISIIKNRKISHLERILRGPKYKMLSLLISGNIEGKIDRIGSKCYGWGTEDSGKESTYFS